MDEKALTEETHCEKQNFVEGQESPPVALCSSGLAVSVPNLMKQLARCNLRTRRV
jgi:hypothetical protein